MRNKLFLIMLLAAVVAGCGGPSAVDEVRVEDQSVNGLDGGEADGARAIGLDDDEYAAGQDLDGNLLAQRVIYFAYDSSVLTPEGEAIVRAHAQYLSDTPNLKLILEGHTDERGTREYNLALAERRAIAVSDVLQALGVAGDRMQTVSYGEERPVALGHDDGAWSLNRRVEILYQ